MTAGPSSSSGGAGAGPTQRTSVGSTPTSSSDCVTILDYGAGNVRSLENAVRLLGYDIHWATDARDIANAQKLIFPGVGSFGAAMHNLTERGYVDALRDYILADRPFLGICLGLHTLFSGSTESPGVAGLDIFPGTVARFDFDPPPVHVGGKNQRLSIPHIGWNTLQPTRPSLLLRDDDHGQKSLMVDDGAGINSAQGNNSRFYFVHSYRVGLDIAQRIPHTVLAYTTHGAPYVSVLQHGRICATQFHPEKSGAAGLNVIRNFLVHEDISVAPPSSSASASASYFSFLSPTSSSPYPSSSSSRSASSSSLPAGLAKRVVACLDVRENDSGDLVVTKGDQYDVRDSSSGYVRNLGKPVSLAQRYFREGADEIVFLNITSFRGEPVADAPMLEVLRETSRRVFVPLCIGGGIRDYTDKNGTSYSALDVADMYFRAGADKVSIGSDAVYATQTYYNNNQQPTGTSSIERISHVYGAQAIVVSIDPRRVYVEDDDNSSEAEFFRPDVHHVVETEDGRKCWYQCTVKGGRQGSNVDVVQLAKAVQALGAGEILLNSMDCDGQNNGYDLQLIQLVKNNADIPVIASSGAGNPSHFSECFDQTDVEAALAAGIFHRKEVDIEDVKLHLMQHGTPVRIGRPVDQLIGKDVVTVNE